MLRKNLLVIIVIILSGIIVALYRNTNYSYQKIAGITQGTTYHITYRDKNQGNLQNEIDSLLNCFDLSLSSYIDHSLISKINANQTNQIDSYLEKILQVSKDVYNKSDGAFDITVGPLVDAWGFGPGTKIEMDSSVIDNLLQYVGFHKIKITDNRIQKASPNIKLDVNAIAQGYSVDVVADYLEKQGIGHYMVEIGGEIKVRGKNPNGEYWRIGIDKPIEKSQTGRELQAIVSLKNIALATSGNYRKFYEKDGVKYTHSVNPKTGYTVSRRLLSCTILTEECILADAYATACIVPGTQKAIDLIESDSRIEGYLIYNDVKGNYKIWQSNGFKDLTENH
jgi:thiamine biosynthesis lipoprotein